MPTQFTFPFRYTPHPLCRKAALIVQDKLKEMGVREGKMYGVLVCKIQNTKNEIENSGEFSAQTVDGLESLPLGGDIEGPIFFLAAYSGQLKGSYNHPWFVPPVVDYLDPESHFQKEQAEIMALSEEMETLRNSEEVRATRAALELMKSERQQAIDEARRVYEASRNNALRGNADYIRMRQHQKADIQRAKHLHAGEIAQAEGMMAGYHFRHRQLYAERKQRSEALQQWLFEQFEFLNARGERKRIIEIFHNDSLCDIPSNVITPSLQGRAGGRSLIPSGAGECCAPKLLQTAYKLGLQPLAMAEFWWGPSTLGHYKEPGAFFPACHSKCRPILTFMLQGLNVEPDPALHYEQTLKPVRVVWEDEHLAVIEKPEGWCSIPGKSDQANLFDEALRLWPAIEGSVIVHRLDQDTSGIMVLAKNARVHRALSQQFERREIKKQYVAILETYPQTPPMRAGNELPVEGDSQKSIPSRGNIEGCVALPLAPNREDLPRQRVDWEHGKEAVTLYEVIGQEEKGTRVRFYPQTGRTHQLRVHAAAKEGLNAPIVGDRLYGHVADRLYLHAEALDFTHPVTHERMHFEAPAPF